MTTIDLTATPVGNYVLDEVVERGLTVETIAHVSEAALYECVALGAAAASSAKWRVPPVRVFPWDAVTTRAEASALSTAVAQSAAARWWSSRALDRAQLWIGKSDATPEPGRVSPRLYGKPPHRIWTSSALDDGTSAWWPLLRRGADSPPPTEPQSVWRLTPCASARVYEITNAHDWARLCTAFPSAESTPDWDAVANEYDGIHVTVEGVLRAQGVPIESARGTAMLDGWDVESSVWLRWCFDAVERVGEVDPDPLRLDSSALRARRPS